MRWFNRYNFPYSNFHDLNLDWILSEMNRIREEWEQVKSEWEQMKIDWEAFQKEMQRLWEEYKQLMDAAWEAYKNQLNAQWAAFKSQMETEWTDYQNQMDEAWELYQREMNQAWETYKTDLNNQWATYQTNLNTAWQNYQTAMNNWKDGVDDEIDALQTAWTNYQNTVNTAITNMQNQINNFISQMEAYIRNNMPAIVSPIVREWLQEHGITVSAFIRPEDEGGLVQALAKAATEHTPILLSPGEDYYFQVNQATIPNGTIIIGYGARIRDTTAAEVTIESNVHIFGLDFSQLGDASSHGTIQISGSHVTLEEVEIDNDIQLIIGPSNSHVTLDRVGYANAITVANSSNLRDLNLIAPHTYNQSGGSIYRSVLEQVQ